MLFALYTAAVFSGAFLLFQVQPLAARKLLPSFGGSPATWTACLLFFQGVLFAGYLYAHLTARLFRLFIQVALHVALLCGAFAFLSLVPDAIDNPAGEASPSLRILALLLRYLGLPCLVLSASAPLLQHWYALTGGDRAYRLYAHSNAGALLALLSYPLAMEPLFGIDRQAVFWSRGFGAFCLVTAAVAIATSLRAGSVRPVLPARDPVRKPVGGAGVLIWFFLAAVPSVMLLAVTNHISVDVAAAPLLWVAPLALYLLSFMLCFGSRTFYRRRLLVPLWLMASAVVAVDLFHQGTVPLWRQLPVFLAALFISSLLCHGELWRLRPSPSRLTSYYLTIAAGGAAGGLFVGLVAPALFVGYFELQIAVLGVYLILLSVLLREPRPGKDRASIRWVWLGLGLGTPLLAATIWLHGQEETGKGKVLFRYRSFYGTLQVTALADRRLLTHGRITHGMQFSAPERRGLPTAYFGPESGVGRALLADSPLEKALPPGAGKGRTDGASLEASGRARDGRRLGVLGLGVGTLAAYGRPGDRIHFYEIDRAVVGAARDYFTFLGDSAARVEVRIGDGRLSLAREPSHGFDLLVLDAFASDSVPVHLITAEAFAVYLRHLAPDGILAANASNRHLDVDRVLAGSARFHRLGFGVVETPANVARGLSQARWLLMARQPQRLRPLLEDVPPGRDLGLPVLWTDARSNLLQVVRPPHW